MLNRNMENLSNKLGSFLKREMDYREVDKKFLLTSQKIQISRKNKGFMDFDKNIYIRVSIKETPKIKAFLDKRKVNYIVKKSFLKRGYNSIFIYRKNNGE